MKAARLLALCCCCSARCRAGFAAGGGVLAKGLANSVLKCVVKATRLQLYFIFAQSHALACADAAAAGALLCAAGSTLTVVGLRVPSQLVDGRYFALNYDDTPHLKSDQHARCHCVCNLSAGMGSKRCCSSAAWQRGPCCTGDDRSC